MAFAHTLLSNNIIKNIFHDKEDISVFLSYYLVIVKLLILANFFFFLNNVIRSLFFKDKQCTIVNPLFKFSYRPAVNSPDLIYLKVASDRGGLNNFFVFSFSRNYGA